MKDPVCIFECRRGFSFWDGRNGADGLQPHVIVSHAIARV